MMDLIDRNELEPDTEWSEYYDGFTSYSQSQINGAVEVQAIIIPENATNGDMIMAMFPNISIYEHGSTYSVNNEYNFNSNWWNAPYKKEVEE